MDIFFFFHWLENSLDTTVPIGFLILGLLTGLRHSLEADHIAAVSTILVGSKEGKIRHASLIGFLWGLGHTITLLVAAVMVLFLSLNIPESVSNNFEFGVGIMLMYMAAISISGVNIMRFFKSFKLSFNKKLLYRHIHQHPHVHGKIVHTHPHEHNDPIHRHEHKAIIIGIIHGMAGSGALMLVVLSSIESPVLGMAYVILFGIGSITGMVLTTTLIGIPMLKLKNFSKVSLVLRFGVPAITLVVGANLIYGLLSEGMIFKL